MPSAQIIPNEDSTTNGVDESIAATRCTSPIPYSGSLDSFAHRDLTPVIGREYDNLQVAELLSDPDGERMIRDLAVTGTFHPNKF